MANKSEAANSAKSPAPTEGNVGSNAAKSTEKTEMDMSDLVNADLTKWKTHDLKCLLLKLKLKATGTKPELVDRLRTLQENNELLEKRLKEVNKTYVFHTSMEGSEIPPPSSAWSADRSLYPKVDSNTVSIYTGYKKQGSKGQFRKARRVFLSRKIKTVKSIKVGDKTFVKAMIIKSFGQEITRPAVVMFQKNQPIKGHCTCPIGKCGICCHVIAVLMFLEYYSKHNACLLSLTVTQKMQKWHRKGKMSGIATRASHIPLRSFRNARSTRKPLNSKTSAVSNDIDKSNYYKRDVDKMSSKIANNVNREHLQQHFYKTLKKYNIRSGLSMQLHYNNSYRARTVFTDHSYCKNAEENYDKDILCPKFVSPDTQGEKQSNIDLVTTPLLSENTETLQDDEHVLMHEKQQDEISHLLELLQGAKETKIKLPLYCKLEPCGFNYVPVKQGSEEWHSLRVGMVTASKLPSLLGFCGHKEFSQAWFCIHNKIDEKKVAPKKFKNFSRGIEFEGRAIKLFEDLSGAPVSTGGFFYHPTDRRYGASPDGIGQTFLVEVKTRAVDSSAPLNSVTASHILQCNQEMTCTGGRITFLESYHPEQNCANIFLIERDNLLLDVCKTVTDSILLRKEITEWPHEENRFLKKLGDQLKENVPTFENTKSLRSWINAMAKTVKQVVFVRDTA